MKHWKREVRLTRTPFAGPAPADAISLPFRDLEDYPAVAELAHVSPTPILVTLAQYYTMLSDLVCQMRTHLAPDAPLLVEVHRPHGKPVPATLLASDVIMADAIDRELTYWCASGCRRVAALRVYVRCELGERGDNRVVFECYERGGDGDPLAALIAATVLHGASVALACHS